MDTNGILPQFDLEQRINIEYPNTRRERRPHVIRYISETGSQHFILYSQLASADIAAVITEEQAYFGPLGKVEWKVYAHDQPADLRQRLAARGFEVEDPEAVMVLDLEETPSLFRASQDIAALADEVTVRRLESVSQLEDVRRIEEAVWNEDFAWITKQLAADMAAPDYLSVYIAYVNRHPACAAWIYFHPNSQFASLWGGSTIPEYRGKGLYTAILGERIREATARGYHFLTIDASPMSQPIVARHGFQYLTTAWACTWRQTP